MSFLPPNFNVIQEPKDQAMQEYLNKIFFDQTVSPYTTAFADFYALMPSDNASPVAVASDVAFPRNGPSSNSDITRVSASSFSLGPIGTYQVAFDVAIDISGQLVLTLNNVEQPKTVVGRGALLSQLSGTSIISTVAANSVLTVRNPVGNVDALPITASAGGADAVSAHLVITRLR